MFIFKVTEPSPLQDSSGVRQQGDLLGPRPPESLIQNPSLPRRPMPRLYCQGCVGVFIFMVTEPSPLQDSFSVRQKGGLPGPSPP